MKLILTRHGETLENRKKRVQGQTHGILSLNGMRQAKLLGQKLKDLKIHAIYTSDLDRALDTAEQIRKHHPNARFFVSKDLRERDFGRMAGKPSADLDWSRLPSYVENSEQILKRVKRIIEQALKSHPKGTVLIVGHGGSGRVIVNHILDRPSDYWTIEDSLRNASISIFEISKKMSRTVIFNDTEHLR